MSILRKKRRRGGSVVVEFALVLPLLLVMSMMMIQYGLILNATLAISSLAREGARFAAVHPGDDGDIQDHVYANMPLGFQKADVTVVITGSKTTNGAITVTVTYNMSKRIFMPKKFFGVTLVPSNFTTFTTMRVE